MTTRTLGRAHGRELWLIGALAAAACGDDSTSHNRDSNNAETTDAAGADSARPGSASDGALAQLSDDHDASSIRPDAGPELDPADDASLDAGLADAGPGPDAARDASAAADASDTCGNALFCESFDSYAGVDAIADKQKLGPWHATVQAGATMGLDGKHKVSGTSALHVHIDQTVTSGGRLFADGAQPIFAGAPTHLYGRMMMYIDPNGTSVHWTFFGANGKAEASSPAAGRSASYILSSLPKKGVNTYSFVYGLQASDGYHDCSSQSNTTMPSTWACVSFELDSVARKLRMYKDGAATPILSVDDHGNGCVAPTAPSSPWYGPAITQLFVGAWSFHAMDAPLDVWIDDLVVDTKPVSCSPPP